MKNDREKVGELLAERTIPQNEIAQRAGIHPSTLSRIRAGKVEPTESQYAALLKALRENLS